MPFIPIPLVRREQPIVPVGINWLHPVARKLSGAWNFVNGPVDTKDLTGKSSQFTVNTAVTRTRANTKFGSAATKTTTNYESLFTKTAGVTTQSAIIFGRVSVINPAPLLIGNTGGTSYLFIDISGLLTLYISSLARATAGAAVAVGDNICAGFNAVSSDEYRVFLNGRPASSINSGSFGVFGSLSSMCGSGKKSGGFSTALLFDFHTKLTEQEHALVYENPWALLQPETIPLFFSTVTAQYARPTSDVSTGTWTASSGSDLFAMLDETSANDTDYIVTTGASTCEVALGSLADPVSSSGHIVRYRIAADSGGITVRLRQGTTTIATWTHASAPTSLTTYEQTLTGGEADSITDYSALRLQFEAT